MTTIAVFAALAVLGTPIDDAPSPQPAPATRADVDKLGREILATLTPLVGRLTTLERRVDALEASQRLQPSVRSAAPARVPAGERRPYATPDDAERNDGELVPFGRPVIVRSFRSIPVYASPSAVESSVVDELPQAAGPGVVYAAPSSSSCYSSSYSSAASSYAAAPTYSVPTYAAAPSCSAGCSGVASSFYGAPGAPYGVGSSGLYTATSRASAPFYSVPRRSSRVGGLASGLSLQSGTARRGPFGGVVVRSFNLGSSIGAPFDLSSGSGAALPFSAGGASVCGPNGCSIQGW